MPQRPAPKPAPFPLAPDENFVAPIFRPLSPFLRKLTSLLDAYYADEHFDVNELSRRFCLCPMHVYRKVKRHTGLSPGKYLLLFRLTKALHLLQNTDCTIGEIAWQTGFGSQNNFTRAFHRVFGSCPRQLRLELRER